MGSRPNERLDIRNRAAEVATSRDKGHAVRAAPGMWWTRQSDRASWALFSSTPKCNMDPGFRLNSLPLVHRSTPGYNLSLLRSSRLACGVFEVAVSEVDVSVTRFLNSRLFTRKLGN